MKPIGRIHSHAIRGRKMRGSSIIAGLVLLLAWGVVLVCAATLAAASIAAGQSEGWQVGFLTASVLALMVTITKWWKDSI